jgi:S1-C subfamily serine protease
MFHTPSLISVLLLGCFIAGAAASDSAPKRESLPLPEDVTAACDTVRDALREELQATLQSGDARGLIVTLKEYARESKDPVRKYALLDVAEQLAIDLNQYSLAMGVAAEKTLQFDVTDMPTRIRILEALVPSQHVDDLVYGIEFATSGLAVAVGAEDFTSAKQMLEGLRTMVASYGTIEKNQESEIRKKYPQLFKSTLLHDKLRSNAVKQAWDKVFLHRRRDDYEAQLAAIEAAAAVVESRRAAAEAWETSARDTTAGPTVGRYFCFDQYDWNKGLSFLAMDEGRLGEVARDEAKTGSTAEAGDAAALADLWWQAAADVAKEQSSLPNDAAAIQSHAAELYLRALPDLPTGYEKEVARKRIGQAAVPRVLSAVESDAAQCRTAAEAVQVYQMFLARDSIPEPMRRAGKVRMQWWKRRAEERYRRFGEDWVSADEYESRVKQAEDRIKHVADLIRMGNITLAKEELDQASRLDPTSGKPDYVIGIVNSLAFNNELLAAYYFGEAARREPDNGYMLCALANTEILLQQPESALRHYVQALEHLPDQFVVENLGVVLRVAGRLGIDDETTRRFNHIYRKAVHDLGLKPAEADRFVFLAPFALDLKKPGAEAGEESGSRGTQDRVQIGSGTGFVVAPNLVLTNRHVVDGCTEIVIVDPNNRDRQLTATVIASSEDPDLALLECEGLEAPAVTIAERLPPRGEDIMCLGFPGGSLLGLALKSTKGSVISLGDEGLDGGNFLHSCIINPGNSGGPIVDQTGRLVGVVVAIVKTNAIGNAYSIGIPVERVRPFVEPEIKKYEESKMEPVDESLAAAPVDLPAGDGTDEAAAEPEPPPPPAPPKPTPPKPLSWAEVDAKVSPSTVFILGKIRSRLGEAAADGSEPTAPE